MRSAVVLLLLLLVAAPLLWLTKQQHDPQPPAPRDGCPSPRPRVALCFYGLNRALRHTVHGIADKIWKPLHDACAAVDVYYHVWEVEAAFVDTAASRLQTSTRSFRPDQRCQ